MKKLILILLFLLIIPSLNSFAAIALLSSSCASSSNGGTVGTTAINTTGATLIVVSLQYFSGAQLNVPTDSVSNTFTQLNINTGSTDPAEVLYYINNPITSASHTFSEVSTPSNNFPSICVSAFSGTTITSPFDVQNGSGGAGLTTLQTGSVTPNQGNELIVTGVGYKVGTLSINSGFTLMTGQSTNAGNGYGAAMAYLIQTTASAVNPTWTDNTSENMATGIATFKALGGGGSPITSTITKAIIRNAIIY